MFATLFTKNHAKKYQYSDNLINYDDMQVKEHGCIIVAPVTSNDSQKRDKSNLIKNDVDQDKIIQNNNTEKRRYYFLSKKDFNQMIKEHTIEPGTLKKQIKAVDASQLEEYQIEIFIDPNNNKRFKSDDDVEILKNINNNFEIFDSLPWIDINLDENSNNNKNLYQKTTWVINRIINRTDRTPFKISGKGKEYITKDGHYKYITRGTRKMINELKKLEKLKESVTQKDADRIGEKIVDDLLTRIEPTRKRDKKTITRHKQAICDIYLMMSACRHWKIPKEILLVESPTPASTPEPMFPK